MAVLVNCVSVRANVQYIRYIQNGVKLSVTLYTQHVTIYILSGIQVAINALDNHQITSKLVLNCHQSPIQLAKHNKVQLIWVPGNEGIAGDETADHSINE
jgi:hypothetical protein